MGVTREEQKTEALWRMGKLQLFPEVIKDLRESNRLFLSERIGFLYWLNEEEQEMIRQWEEETGNFVYHVIKSNIEFGLCYSFLYVSIHAEEWPTDRGNLQSMMPLVYVKNATYDDCSEYGFIAVKPNIGGLVRIA